MKKTKQGSFDRRKCSKYCGQYKTEKNNTCCIEILLHKAPLQNKSIINNPNYSQTSNISQYIQYCAAKQVFGDLTVFRRISM